MKAFKKTLALFLATLMIVSAFSLYSVFAVTNGDDAVPESGMVTTNTPTLLGGTATASEPVPMSNTGTATANWAEETRNGVTAFYVDDLDDFKAFHDNSEANAWYTNKTVYITDDLDMTQASWTWTKVASFRGTLDGQGNTLNLRLTDSMYANAALNATFKNLKVTGTATGTSFAVFVFQPMTDHTVNFKNIDIEMTVTGTGPLGVFVARPNNGGVTINIDNCTNRCTVTGTAYGVGGYVARAEVGSVINITNSVFEGTVTANKTGTTAANGGGFVGEIHTNGGTIDIENCVFSGTVESTGACGGFVGAVQGESSVTIDKSASIGTIKGDGGGKGGFIGRVYNESTAILTDCVFTGDASAMPDYSSAVVGYIQGAATLTRCVSLGKETTLARNTHYGAVFYSVNAATNEAPSKAVTAIDCYAAVNAYAAHNRHSTDVNTVTADVTTIANSEGSSLSAANFKAVCPELAANGWVATTNTVTYADGLTVPEILPATVATMLGRTVAASPVNAEQWHVKDNGETVDVRFIGSIKEDEAFLAKYDNVGIQITVVLKDTEDQILIDAKKYNSTSVYTTVNTDASGVPAFVAEDGTYLFTANMRGFLKSATYEVTFVAFATYGGVDIFDYDGATTVTVTNGAIAE